MHFYVKFVNDEGDWFLLHWETGTDLGGGYASKGNRQTAVIERVLKDSVLPNDLCEMTTVYVRRGHGCSLGTLISRHEDVLESQAFLAVRTYSRRLGENGYRLGTQDLECPTFPIEMFEGRSAAWVEQIDIQRIRVRYKVEKFCEVDHLEGSIVNIGEWIGGIRHGENQEVVSLNVRGVIEKANNFLFDGKCFSEFTISAWENYLIVPERKSRPSVKPINAELRKNASKPMERRTLEVVSEISRDISWKDEE